MTTPADELRAASARLRELAKAIHAPDLPDQSWHAEECADSDLDNCPCIVAQGQAGFGDGDFAAIYYVADTETPELAAYIVAMGPNAGVALAEVFDAWARMVDLDPDLLNRIGGQETLAVARQINTGSRP